MLGSMSTLFGHIIEEDESWVKFEALFVLAYS